MRAQSLPVQDDPMLHESTQRLILKLHEMTAHGEIAWKEGPRLCSVYETEGYQVEIESTPPSLRILHADGRELERVQEPELRATPWVGGDGDFATRLTEMAERAHRVARGAEAAIATILSALSAPARANTPPAETGPVDQGAQPDPSENQPGVEPEPTGQTPATQDRSTNNPIVVSPPGAPSSARVLSLTRNQPVARFGPSFGSIDSFKRGLDGSPGTLEVNVSSAADPPAKTKAAPSPAPADVYKPWA